MPLIAQGFQLGLLDNVTTPGTPIVRILANITNRGDVGGQASDVEYTTLDDKAKRKLKGLVDNGSMTNEVNLEPDDTVQQLLWKLNKMTGSAATATFFILGSGGEDLPIVTAGNLVWTGVTDRIFLYFDAYVSGFKLGGVTPDQIQKATIPLTVDGEITASWEL